MFFIAVGLLTVLLATEMRHGMVTLSWGLEGVAVFVLALWLGERSFRLTGLGLLLLCVGKILLGGCVGTGPAGPLPDLHRAGRGSAAGVVSVHAESRGIAAIPMKRWIIFAGIVLLSVASVVVSERRKVDVPASPAALLYLVADTEQELTRMPVSFARMSDAEEIRIGDELARSYAAREERENTPEAAIVSATLPRDWVGVGQRTRIANCPTSSTTSRIRTLVNAFALPGGHVYVGGGLLSLMDSEDELAAVIGHEIEHIDHYHCADRVQQEQALRKIPLGGLVALPIEVFEAGYSKDQELEADREGTRLAVQAGYSASGAIRMFETLRAAAPGVSSQGEDATGGTIAGGFSRRWKDISARIRCPRSASPRYRR